MIFVTLGSQKFQFDRLLKEIDRLIADKKINNLIFAQIGESTYEPKFFKYKRFLDRNEFTDYLEASDLIITHGGTGVIINAAKKNKKIIAVPRLKKYGEHVDDHQLQLIKEFEEMEIIEGCYEIEKLEDSYKKVLCKTYKKYESNTLTIINSIEEFLENLN